MEEILCRFPHLGKQIFAELDDLSLAKSRETNRQWLHFICNEKFYENRINEMLSNKAKLRGDLLRWPRSKVHCAAFYGQTQIVMDILEDSSEKNPSNDKLTTPLHLAAEKGFVSICKYIIGGIDDKFPKDERGRTPLHFAALNGHLRVCELILNNTESLVDKNFSNKNPFSYLDMELGSMYTTCYVLGQKTYLPTGAKLSPLNLAASCGHLEVCKLILQHVHLKYIFILDDKSFVAPANKLWSPLHSAAQKGQLEVFEFLMETIGVENVFKLDHCTLLVLIDFCPI